MRSTLRFIMHPDDEREFFRQILSEEDVFLIDGPIWKAPIAEPRSPSEIGTYCIIWSPKDRPSLTATLRRNGDWYCDSEMVTIQFLRSEITNNLITQGSIAIATNLAAPDEAAGVEKRFRVLTRFIKKKYKNSVVSWYPAEGPRPSAELTHPALDQMLDPLIWVGPFAEQWLREDHERLIRQHWSYGAYAILSTGMGDGTKPEIAIRERPRRVNGP
ncbi:hypothetical protein [Pseudorhizobium pelagicum]|uniref:Uncharacterized protein n=1 Tax=Pseudorhizobium pelagicum TaxID=1509405 RepID=A0A922NYP2_9HYPH|nr:hypothetical protein [Pseudorhizobium pelagicum]KEQ03222.1 hypothetical protein GV68_17660 [Pseudorhizobium pelagicum]KEQ04905.1 hypothetical protein GV67_07350 [Pseudorhizobium pelagicum]